MIESFERRIGAPRTKGYPDLSIMLLSGVPIMVGIVVMVPVVPVKLMFGFMALCCFAGGALTWYHYDDYFGLAIAMDGTKDEESTGAGSVGSVLLCGWVYLEKQPEWICNRSCRWCGIGGVYVGWDARQFLFYC